MPSPFPGMDPFLEPHWRDVHARLIIYACDQIQAALPGELYARVEERVFLETEEGNGQSRYPDVRVVEEKRARKWSNGRGTALLEAAEPIIVRSMAEPVTETYLEILEAGTERKVITVIEFLSPSNKTPGEGQKLYRQKQHEIMHSTTSLVEIDLLRAGDREFSLRSSQMPSKLQALYQVCVRRGWKRGEWEIYSITLQERLPILRIPLREKDEDVPLDLQALLDQAYRNGRYEETLDYQQPLKPALTKEEAKWFKRLIGKGKHRNFSTR